MNPGIPSEEAEKWLKSPEQGMRRSSLLLVWAGLDEAYKPRTGPGTNDCTPVLPVHFLRIVHFQIFSKSLEQVCEFSLHGSILSAFPDDRVQFAGMLETYAQSEPKKATLVLQVPSDLMQQQLAAVIVWCTSSTSERHWMTSYPFAGGKVNAQGQQWEGVSIDMSRPMNHERLGPEEKINLHGSLQIQARPWMRLTSKNAPCLMRINFIAHVTVAQLSSDIDNSRLAFYDFNPSGGGCMNWQLALLDRFVSLGWIAKADSTAVHNQLASLAEVDPAAFRYPPRLGTFVGQTVG